MSDNAVPPRIATWLLRLFGSSPKGEAIAGDLIERWRSGKSYWWLWKQIAIVLVLNFRVLSLGLVAGLATAATGVLGNLRHNDPRGISFFPDLVSPLVLITIVCATVR